MYSATNASLLLFPAIGKIFHLFSHISNHMCPKDYGKIALKDIMA